MRSFSDNRFTGRRCVIEAFAQFPFFFKPEIALVQALGFLFFFWVLRNLLFGRILRFVHDREQAFAEAETEVARREKEFVELEQQYGRRIAEAEKAAYEATQSVFRVALAERSGIISRAYDHAFQRFSKAHRTIEQETKDALRELGGETNRLAEEIAKAVLSADGGRKTVRAERSRAR